MFTSVASLVFALAAALTIIRCDCFFFSLPNYRLQVKKTAASVIRRDAANLTPISVQSSTRIRSTAGADSLGFSSTLSKEGYSLPTQVIFGSNSIEHGVNLIEEKTNSVILVSGWNSARLDPILWELEPRGFKLGICCVTEEPSYENVHEVLAAVMQSNCGAVIAMGCGSVIETAKLATMLINTHTDREHLAGLSAIELGNLIKSMTAGDHQKSVGRILLVSIPSLPSLGAELASVTAVRTEIQSYSKREVTKMYVRSMAPDLCLVQPSLTYRAPMALVHDRLLALIATSVDIILSDPGFLPELLAWDALRQLILLLDKAIEAAQDRFTKWTLDPDSFEKQTVHDDEKDHRSQQFRRYGHGFSLPEIEDLCRIGISIASARSGMHVGGIQYISDSMGQATEQRKGHTNRVGHLLPSYLIAVLNWCESDESVASQSSSRRRQSSAEDPLKSYIRTKLNKISEVFQTSKYIADRTPVTQSMPSGDLMAGGREIVGETSGQIIASTASTANPAPQLTLAGSLEGQMDNLINQFRLLAGPIGPDEEDDISVRAEGDSLSALRRDINRRKDSGETDPESYFKPEEFEKEHKMNFNITDDISEKEIGLDGNEIITTTMMRKRSSRAMPYVRLSTVECTYLLEEMRSTCGKSPAGLLSVQAIQSIFSGPNDHSSDGVYGVYGVSTYQQVERTQQQQRLKVKVKVELMGDEVGDSSIEDIVTHSPITNDSNDIDDGDDGDQNEYNEDDQSDSSSNSNSDSSSDVNEGHYELENGVKRDRPLIEIAMESGPGSAPTSTYSPFVMNFLSVSKALKDVQNVQIGSGEHSSTIEGPVVEDVSTTSPPLQDSLHDISLSTLESNSDATGESEKFIPNTVTVDNSRTKLAENAAAAHRRKVKNMLAKLSSQCDDNKDDSKDSKGTEKGRSEKEKEQLEVKKKSSKSALVEEQADVLARLLEQRIHDRWAEAAKVNNAIPRPFR